MKIALQQQTKQKLLPQQVQFVQLLQTSYTDLQKRIAKELEENPALEEKQPDIVTEEVAGEVLEQPRPYSFKTKTSTTRQSSAWEHQLPASASWQEELEKQLNFLRLDKPAHLIGLHILGSLDADGYLRRRLEAIIEDVSLTYGLSLTLAQGEQVLHQIQMMEPIGVASRKLEEYLLLQLQKKETTAPIALAIQLVQHHFNLVVAKNYKKLMTTLAVSAQELKEALYEITQLRPQPVPPTETSRDAKVLQPDFVITDQDKLTVSLVKSFKNSLAVRNSYKKLLEQYRNIPDKKNYEAVAFVQHNINRAKWFINAIEQREQTFLKIMNTIVELQEPFFKEKDESKLQPIFLRNVAEKVGMDVSAISRAISDKVVQTSWGIYPLKYFFSEPIPSTHGGDVSNRVVKKELQTLIEEEDKQHPLTDQALVEALKQKGYLLARRTVAKYREQLGLPVASLRKKVL